MRLLLWSLAPYSKKTLVAAFELGVQIEVTQVVPYGNDALAPLRQQYGDPLLTLPVLVRDDGSVLTESSIIIEHLDTELRLIPSLQVRAADRFADVIFADVDRLVWTYTKRGQRDEKTLATLCHLHLALQQLPRYLQRGDLTLADISLATAVNAAIYAQLVSVEELPAIGPWYETQMQRPAWRQLAAINANLPRPF